MAKRFRVFTCALPLSLAAATASPEVVVVVSAANPVETLSRAQLTDIYDDRLQVVTIE